MNKIDWDFALDDDDTGDIAGASSGAQYRATKDCLIVLLDGSEAMFSEKSSYEDEKELCCFDVALKAIYNHMCQKAISGSQEHMALVVLNTQKSDTGDVHRYEHICVWQQLDVPNIDRVQQVKDMIQRSKANFKTLFGGHASCSLYDAFLLAQQLANDSGTTFGSFRAFVFTNNCRPADKTDEPRLKLKLSDLLAQGWLIDVIPVAGSFPRDSFWPKSLGLEADIEADDRLDEMMDSVRRREISMRSMANIDFQLAEGVNLAVNIYNPIAQARVPTAVNLDRTTNERLITCTSYFKSETGELLRDRDMMKYQEYGGQKIAFEFDEVEQMKRLRPPGLVLLGFKSLETLKLHHFRRSGLLLQPDDRVISGSTTAFRALLERCLARRVYGICRFTPRANAAPCLVALLPINERRDSDNRLREQKAFHVCFLPFGDDLRDLSSITEGKVFEKANAEQVSAAKKLMNALKTDWEPDQINNPALSKHYRGIEAIALNITDDELPPFEDQTKPKEAQMLKVAGDQLKAFKQSIGYDDEKRPASSGGPAAKKPNVENVDLRAEAVAGRLGKLTVPGLKELALKERVQLGGVTKKADIITAIQRHYKI